MIYVQEVRGSWILTELLTSQVSSMQIVAKDACMHLQLKEFSQISDT